MSLGTQAQPHAPSFGNRAVTVTEDDDVALVIDVDLIFDALSEEKCCMGNAACHAGWDV